MGGIGYVTLVGAGPGDPGLLTVRGKEALSRADVVLIDRLVGDEIRAMIPERTVVVDVGKTPGRHPIPQEQINELLFQYAREGKNVVRLKGGDPYLFGRGAEELEAIAAAGIPFRVIPGVTSAIAAPSYGGIPVTHRDFASSLHIITGHPRQSGELDIPYESLAKLGGTLVFLMGVHALGELTEGLLAAGMEPDMPAALIENGARPEQRQLTAPLSTIAKQARREGYKPPSVFVVGRVCALSSTLNWHAQLPLAGTRVLVTRPAATAGAFSSLLREMGCAVTEFPCIRTMPLPTAAVFQRLDRYDWIVLTSAVGVELFFENLYRQGRDARALGGIKFAVIGKKTGQALRKYGILADFFPADYNSKALAEGLVERMPPQQRVLLYRAKEGAPELPATLRRHGHLPEDVAAYATDYNHPDSSEVRRQLENGEIDYVAFTSAATVHGFVCALEGLPLPAVRGVCIGEETAAAARGYGIPVLVSNQATLESMAECMAANN